MGYVAAAGGGKEEEGPVMTDTVDLCRLGCC